VRERAQAEPLHLNSRKQNREEEGEESRGESPLTYVIIMGRQEGSLEVGPLERGGAANLLASVRKKRGARKKGGTKGDKKGGEEYLCYGGKESTLHVMIKR